MELIKEILGDSSVKVDKQRIKYVQEYFQDEIKKEEAIQARGHQAYYTDKIKAFWQFWQTYGYAVYVGIMLIILAVLVFQLSAGILVDWITGIDWLPGISFLLTGLETVFLLFYIFCKTHHKKWKAAAGIVILVLAKQIWSLIHAGSISGSLDTVLLLMLFLAVHHYEQWKREFAEKSEMLKQWLRDEEFPDDEIIEMYHALEQLRFEGGRKAGRMKQDEEIDEMLLYLNWLKRDDNAAELLEEIRTDAVAESYEGLVLPEPAKKLETEAAEQKEPLNRRNAGQRLAMPLLFTVMFPVFYLAVSWFLDTGKQDADQGGMILCAAVIAGLAVLVLATFGHYEKHPRRKFWMELAPAVGLEFMSAFDVYCLLSGYYIERGARGMKSFLLFLCVGIPWFVSYVNKTQKNWKRMCSAGKTKG